MSELSRYRLVRRKARRVFSFVMLAAWKGVGAWKPIWTAFVFVMGWALVSLVAMALKADVLTILFAIVVTTVLTLGVGAFRLWDELDETVELNGRGGGPMMSASLTGHVSRQRGDVRPDEIWFDLGLSEMERTLTVANEHGRAGAYALQFREPCRRTVRRNDVPKWIRWGPPWRRRELLVKGFSDQKVLLERTGPLPGAFRIEIYFADDT